MNYPPLTQQLVAMAKLWSTTRYNCKNSDLLVDYEEHLINYLLTVLGGTTNYLTFNACYQVTIQVDFRSRQINYLIDDHHIESRPFNLNNTTNNEVIYDRL